MSDHGGDIRRPGRRGAGRYLAPAALVAVGAAVVLIVATTGGSSSAVSVTVPTGRASPRPHGSRAARSTTTQVSVTGTAGTSTDTGTSTVGNYTVAAGDTFAKISAQSGVSIATIESLNPGVSSNSLKIGQVLKLK